MIASEKSSFYDRPSVSGKKDHLWQKKADPRRTERRARALLTGKEIPPAKMELVRSLMSNDKLLPEEKYSAIIDLLQNCPDKKVPVTRSPSKIETARRVKKPVSTVTSRPVSLPDIGPTHSSIFIDELYARFREHRLFARKYLILRPGRWKIGIKKRLVPTRRLYRLLKDIRAQQERLQNRLPGILEGIINDPDIQNPVHFNYLRLLQKWLMETPLIAMPLSETRWFDEYSFDTELKNYVRQYFSFMQLDGEMREAIILQVENKLRELPDLKKEQVVEGDTDAVINEKEKRNLKKKSWCTTIF
jgi:hypothetical protein